MTQEDRDLLLKDLSTRLPYGVVCHANEINIDGELIFVNKLYNIASLYDDNATGKFRSCPINDIKPYLRPLSSMTEEERDEVEEISHRWFYINEDGEIFPMGRFTDSGEFEDAILPTFEYFLKNHFDYRGLIEKGLALEAPEDMYK